MMFEVKVLYLKEYILALILLNLFEHNITNFQRIHRKPNKIHQF